MPGKLRNSRSWFTRTRRSADFRTVADLAQALALPKGTVHQWERGSAHRPPTNRPSWGQMLRLKEAFRAQLEELVWRLWGEKVGDPAPCGCGRLAFPERPTAHKLVIKLPCVQCGKERTYPQGKHYRHRKLCQTCGNSGERAKFIKVKCRDCQKMKRGRESYFKPLSSFDPASNPPTYVCNNCGSLKRLNARLDKELRRIEAKELGKGVKIRSRKARLELFRDHRHQIWDGKLRVGFSPEAQEQGRQRYANNAAMGKRYPKKGKANLKRHWDGPDLPKRLCVGMCRFCKKFNPTMNSRDPHFHKQCHDQWEHTPEGRRYQSLKVVEARRKKLGIVAVPATEVCRQEARLVKPKRGRPEAFLDNDALFVAYRWTVQRGYGKSFRQIKKDDGVAYSTVRDAVLSLLKTRPAPNLVAARFQPTMQLFDDLARSLLKESEL